tara:strand:+ start:666 stop:947 length:282 start_codon:yes stop_codon:yes gene_type:complete
MTKRHHKCDDESCSVHKALTDDRKNKLAAKKSKVKKTKKPIITDVFSEDYSVIDETIENIKITSRKICQDQYSSNNVYIILQDALKKVILADK